MRNYFYKSLSKFMGEHELLYTTQSECAFIRSGETLRLNSYFPSVLYGAGLPNDDKNYPLKLFLYQSPADCAHVERDGLNLLAVVKFANSGQMKTREGDAWVTVANETVDILEALVCERDTKVS